tara:strand:+ start:782 stop:1501 length:720 start_codon:yes stop_codon:yes gene_type:complete
MSEWYDNQKKPSSDWRKKLAKHKASRKQRKLTAKEKKRLEKLEGMLLQLKGGKNVQNRQLKNWLTENEYKEFEESWKQQKEIREEFVVKPSEVVEYEEKLSKAIFTYNRAEGYRRKGKSKSAREMGQKADVQFERLLEYFEEIMADLSLQIWFDRGVDLTPNGDTTLSPQGVPRVVTSRSLDLQYGGFRSFISTKKEVKIESLEHAIDELKYESESSEPSSNNDTKRLREFLESMNELE